MRQVGLYRRRRKHPTPQKGADSCACLAGRRVGPENRTKMPERADTQVCPYATPNRKGLKIFCRYLCAVRCFHLTEKGPIDYASGGNTRRHKKTYYSSKFNLANNLVVALFRQPPTCL